MLKSYLKTHGITQTRFAQMVGATGPTISRIIKGENLPSLALAAKIEAATGGAIKASSWIKVDSLDQGEAA